MSIPTVAFLDTSIFAGQQYNFSSVALQAFLVAARERKLIVLLPAPTEMEIERQIEDRAMEAVRSLEDIRKKSPFLAGWSGIPSKTTPYLAHEATTIGRRQLVDFLNGLGVTKLGYDGVNLARIMSWYERATPPFAIGKKRKEFPDAFAVAILENYAVSNTVSVAVVSEDGDFKKACERYPSLLYFSSLGKLTELLLKDQTQIELIRDAITDDLSLLESDVVVAANEHEYTHWFRDIHVRDAIAHSANITDIRIVTLGSSECTLTFEASVDFEFSLAWEDWDQDRQEPISFEECGSDVVNIGGTAKVKIDPDTSSITEIMLLETDAGEHKVDAMPRQYRR